MVTSKFDTAAIFVINVCDPYLFKIADTLVTVKLKATDNFQMAAIFFFYKKFPQQKLHTQMGC